MARDGRAQGYAAVAKGFGSRVIERGELEGTVQLERLLSP